MYQVGNYVVCKSGGIWKIEEISNGQCKLAEYGTSATADVPVGDDEIVRKIISKEAMLDVISRVGFIRTLQAPNDRIRKEFYEGAMAEYGEIEWIKVIKTVYLRQEEKRLFPGEAEFAKKQKNICIVKYQFFWIFRSTKWRPISLIQFPVTHGN